jgi:hypothetical protein
VTGVIEILSLLEIAVRNKDISEMNFSILKREFESLVTLINESNLVEREDKKNTLFSKDFFEISQNYFQEEISDTLVGNRVGQDDIVPANEFLQKPLQSPRRGLQIKNNKKGDSVE